MFLSFTEQLTQSSEHLVCFMDRLDKPVAGTTYKDLADLVTRINGCGYFDGESETQLATAETDPTKDGALTSDELETVEQPEEEGKYLCYFNTDYHRNNDKIVNVVLFQCKHLFCFICSGASHLQL